MHIAQRVVAQFALFYSFLPACQGIHETTQLLISQKYVGDAVPEVMHVCTNGRLCRYVQVRACLGRGMHWYGRILRRRTRLPKARRTYSDRHVNGAIAVGSRPVGVLVCLPALSTCCWQWQRERQRHVVRLPPCMWHIAHTCSSNGIVTVRKVGVSMRVPRACAACELIRMLWRTWIRCNV